MTSLSPVHSQYLVSICFLFVVYILTDDQDLKLGSMDALPVVKSLMTEQGLNFENAFVTTPVCCPSRYFAVSLRSLFLRVHVHVRIHS